MCGKNIAIILAAGSGKRMKSKLAKQYLNINGKPVLYYSLLAFEKSNIDEIILVVSKETETYCREHVLKKNSFSKIRSIVYGGKERYESVYNALKEIECADYVLVHDGARPCIEVEKINQVIESVAEYKACVVGVKSKDTIKIADCEGYILETPNRSHVWNVQTPQAFQFDILKEAYEKIMEYDQIQVTDDAMVVETIFKIPIKMIEGSYSNIKITTPEDIEIVKAIL